MSYWETIQQRAKEWLKYTESMKLIITPRFLSELIIPQDVFSVVNKLNLTDPEETRVYRFIIACSLFNGILVGLPGTLGWGVLAAQAVEVMMALQIARMVGLIDSVSLKKIPTLFKLISATGITLMAVTWGFKKALDLFFNLFSSLPAFVPATFGATTITTLFYGLFLYLAFIEIRNFESFKKLGILGAAGVAKNAGKYTYEIGKSIITLVVTDTPRLFTEIKENVLDAWNGVSTVRSKMKGDIFLAGVMAYLLQEKYDELEGPFTQLWIESWRLSFPVKLGPDASLDDIRILADSYDGAELESVQQLINSKFFELLETHHENADGDEWSAELFYDQNHPTGDAIFFNETTGKSYQINYKLSENKSYLESHIQEHPDVPIIAPADVAEKMNHPLIFSGHENYDSLNKISSENFDDFLSLFHGQYLGVGAVASGFANLMVYLFPFCMAYYRGNISSDQFKKALKIYLPEVTGRTINRVAMLALIGPVYAMYLVASIGIHATMFNFDDDGLEANSNPINVSYRKDF